MPSPHPPWVFNADGSPRTVGFREDWLAETPASTGLTIDELKAGYAGQVADVDRRLLEALPRLDAAIAARGRPAITIVFSDHGSWIGADGGDIRLRFKNLLAIRSTGQAVDIGRQRDAGEPVPRTCSTSSSTPGGRASPTREYRFGTESAFELYAVDDPDAAASP